MFFYNYDNNGNYDKYFGKPYIASQINIATEVGG